jgi:hypothetical protein
VRIIGSGLRAVVTALVNGDALGPAVAIAGLSVVLAVVMGVLKHRG